MSRNDTNPTPTDTMTGVLESDIRPGETMLSIRDLRTYYGSGKILGGDPVKAVDGVSFDIHRGETLGLVGESGCGKTTLGRTLVRLEEATGGEVVVGDTDVTEISGEDLQAWRQNAQIVFQDPQSSLNDRLTVGEIVREPLDVHDWKTPDERRERVQNLLDKVGLQEQHYYRYPHQFSGGQRQRVGVARALALEPEFVVLDEPVSALDVSVQAQILNLLMDLQEDLGLTYLFIAHDLSVVEHICDRVAVMYLGNIMEIGPTENIFTNPQHPYTRSLLSAVPGPDPSVGLNRIPLRGTPPSPRDPPKGCPVMTRCPMKIRPAEFDDVSEETWDALEVFRDSLRARSRADRTLSEQVKEFVGLDTRFATVDEVVDELFDDRELPPTIQEAVENAADLAREGKEETAQQELQAAFGSVCDTEQPEAYEVDQDGRLSRCHRHHEEYAEPSKLDVTGEVQNSRY